MANWTAQFFILFFIAAGSSVWLLFLARIVAALFSAKVRTLISKRPTQHVIWGCLALLCFLGIQSFLNTGGQPPTSVKLQNQLKLLEQRVQTNGGWEALRRDCISLMEQNKDEYFERDGTNGLPPTIATLKPMKVEYLPSRYLSELKNGRFSTPPNDNVVRHRGF